MKKKHTLLFLGMLFMLTILIAMAPQRTSAEGIYDSITVDNRVYIPEVKDGKYTYMLPYEADVSGIYDINSKPADLTVMKGSQGVAALWLNMTEEDCAFMHKTKGNEAVITADIFNVSDDTQKILAAPAEVKGRGNVSWTRAKKSYQVKFDSKQDVLGMGKSKRWILLPASYDLSMVRNALGFELSKRLEMEYACDYRYVDLYMAGRYYGVYIICEKIELKKHRVDIDSVDDSIEAALGKDVFLSDMSPIFENGDYSTAIVGANRIDMTGGYHLEFDNYYENKYQFTTEKDCRVTINAPEMISDGKDVKTNEAYTYIKEFVQKAEDAVYGTDEKELLKYIDIESFAKMWLIKDFMADADATNNMHFWKESDITGDGLIHAGPAWDFDCTMDRDSTSVKSAKYQFVNEDRDGSAKWLGDLLKHQVFRDELLKQYNQYKYLFTTETVNGVKTSPLRETVIQLVDSYAESSKMDTVRWTGTADFCKNITDFDDADREVSANVVKAFIIKRNDYLDERMGEVKAMISPEVVPEPTQEPDNPNNPNSDVMPTPTVSPHILPRETPTICPTAPPANDLSDNISKTPDPGFDVTKQLEKGDKIRDKKGTAIYLVKSVKKGKIKVSLHKLLNKKVKRYKVPKKVVLYNGKKANVTAISSGAFKKCKKLKKVVAGENIKSIGKGARKYLK